MVTDILFKKAFKRIQYRIYWDIFAENPQISRLNEILTLKSYSHNLNCHYYYDSQLRDSSKNIAPLRTHPSALTWKSGKFTNSMTFNLNRQSFSVFISNTYDESLSSWYIKAGCRVWCVAAGVVGGQFIYYSLLKIELE